MWDQAPDVISAVAAVFDGAAQTLESTDFAVACPIATVALEVAGMNEGLRLATAEVFEAWIAAGAARFESEGISADGSYTLAITVIALLEGAFILSQSLKDTGPVHAAGAAATAATRQRARRRRPGPPTIPGSHGHERSHPRRGGERPADH